MSGKYMRKCNKCGIKHAPPTGKKCTMGYSDEETSMPSLEGDTISETVNWAEYGAASRTMENPFSFSPRGGYMNTWPCLSSHENKPEDIKKETGPPNNMITTNRNVTGKVTFEPDITKSELKAVKDDVLSVKKDLDRMAAESRTSLAKISHIEDMLRESLLVNSKLAAGPKK